MFPSHSLPAASYHSLYGVCALTILPRYIYLIQWQGRQNQTAVGNFPAHGPHIIITISCVCAREWWFHQDRTY